MFERMFHEGKGYHWQFDTVIEDARRAAGEWRFSYTVSDAIPRSAGRPVRFKGMSVFDLEGGKIAAYREYADTGVALLQLGFKPEGLAKVLAKRVPAA
jgi:predicted ester cyclase